MDSRTRQINYKGKVIFMMDFSNLKSKQEIQEVISESISFIRSQPHESLLTFTILSDMFFNNEVRDLFTNFLKGNKPYVKGGAVIGLNGLQQILYNALMKLTGRDIKSFNNEISAKDWLVSLN